MKLPGTILLSRPDALGDAVVTLTMAGWIKHHSPHTRVVVLARRYTEAVWRQCAHVDGMMLLEDMKASGSEGAIAALRALSADAIVHVFPHREVAFWAKAAGIPQRIGTSHRWWHWFTCNKRVDFSRKNSELHEGQLNLKLLIPFGVAQPASPQELIPHLGYSAPEVTAHVRALLHPGRRNILLHPLLGSGVGWGLDNFSALLRALDPDRYHCIITGTEKEAERYRSSLPLDLPHVTDAGGRLDLHQLMQMIGHADAFVSASTGPLHLAAASGVRAIGLFSMCRPIFPQRWAPLGRDAHTLVFDPHCATCASGGPCTCIQRISPQRVLDLLPK